MVVIFETVALNLRASCGRQRSCEPCGAGEKLAATQAIAGEAARSQTAASGRDAVGALLT